MKRKCDQCERPATTHSVEIIKGQKIEKHLCDLHAAEQGLTLKATQQPINELLDSLVKIHSGNATKPAKEPVCEHCNTSYKQFREQSLLGCPGCYAAFETQLSSLLERAHEGATHHVGKAPRRAGMSEQRQQQLMHLRKRLGEAVTVEDYELAARLRDEIHKVENNN